MKRFKFLKIGIFILSSLLIVSIALAGSLPDEWTEINPAGFEYNGLTPACSCAPGTPDDEFTFFVKGGKKKNLVIFFQGGGGCWDYMNCVAAPTYNQYQFEELWMFSDDMEGQGIFDQTRKDNPFKDWGFVYIPYCTGDLFWGANDANYYGTEIKHRGFVNFQAVLKYIEDHTNFPGKIFVTGASAGSYGATMAFPYIKQSFPWSNAYLLGDAGNGVMGGTFPTEGIDNWNVQMPDWIFPDGFNPTMTMEEIYTKIAAEYPCNQLAQYTTAFDGIQIFFYNVMLNIDNPYEWENITAPVIGAWHYTMKDFAYNTAAASPNYRYYIAAGTDHTILRSPKFYTEDSAEGVSFVEWVDRMIKTPRNPRKWKSLECEDCLP
ncbi:MAG: hypothetical protein HF978_16945 [Desulfobacteraceae bacterium]|nr:hypothetical protein [Desulfobacteraceae bacterium]MBC2757232.1 hypothetical protein [Desulfobacteraceae bacterium]